MAEESFCPILFIHPKHTHASLIAGIPTYGTASERDTQVRTGALLIVNSHGVVTLLIASIEGSTATPISIP
jgi:hypothetical protein